MRSGTAIRDTIVVALKSEMKMLSPSGSIRRTTCGSVIRRRIRASDMPKARPASTLPFGIGLDAGPEGLGEIAAVDEAERNHGGNEGMELDAGAERKAEQQRQDEVHPHQHDVVGRVAEKLDVKRADPAQRARPAQAHERGGQAEDDRREARAGEDPGVEQQAAEAGPRDTPRRARDPATA